MPQTPLAKAIFWLLLQSWVLVDELSSELTRSVLGEVIQLMEADTWVLQVFFGRHVCSYSI